MTNKEKKIMKVWETLKEQGNLTRMECVRKCHYINLPDLVWKWRKNGIAITHKDETNNKGETWRRYYITKKEAKRAEKEHLIRGRIAC